MNILTKICVVVLLVLILLACPVFITQATVAPNYRYYYEQETERAEMYAQGLRQAELANKLLIQQRDRAVKLAADTNLAKRKEVQQLQSLLAEKQLEATRFQLSINSINEDLAKLRVNLDHELKRNAALSAKLNESWAKINKITEENRQTGELLRETQAEVERLEKVARVRHEQLAEREEQIRVLERKLEATGKPSDEAPAGAVVVRSSVKISGTVTAVRGDLASVNVGSAKGLKTGMKLIVYRGAEFVAHLRIQEVDTNQAAGIVLDKRLAVKQGDKVATSLK
ncbi:MAG: hypothetical protein SVT52_04420 [Planctomycetota bacterium]|nr:hypothetical protein [Planctomycetota bacterium]